MPVSVYNPVTLRLFNIHFDNIIHGEETFSYVRHQF